PHLIATRRRSWWFSIPWTASPSEMRPRTGVTNRAARDIDRYRHPDCAPAPLEGSAITPWPAVDPPPRRPGRLCLISSMTPVSAALSRKCGEVVESRSRFRRSAFTGHRSEPIAAAGGGQIPHRATRRDAGEDRSMAREGYFILDSDLHLMEPYDLWERYLEGPHKASPPHFFAAPRRPEEEVKAIGME